MESMSPPIHSLVYSTTSEAAEVDAAVVGAAVVCDSDAEDASSEVLSRGGSRFRLRVINCDGMGTVTGIWQLIRIIITGGRRAIGSGQLTAQRTIALGNNLVSVVKFFGSQTLMCTGHNGRPNSGCWVTGTDVRNFFLFVITVPNSAYVVRCSTNAPFILGV